MNIKEEIKSTVKNGSSEDALLLASSFKEARVKEIFSVISEDSDTAFKALKYIEEAKSNKEIIESAASKPEYARVIIEDLEQLRNEKNFKLAVNNEPYWASYYLTKYNLKFKWIVSLSNEYNKRPDLNVVP